MCHEARERRAQERARRRGHLSDLFLPDLTVAGSALSGSRSCAASPPRVCLRSSGDARDLAFLCPGSTLHGSSPRPPRSSTMLSSIRRSAPWKSFATSLPSQEISRRGFPSPRFGPPRSGSFRQAQGGRPSRARLGHRPRLRQPPCRRSVVARRTPARRQWVWASSDLTRLALQFCQAPMASTTTRCPSSRTIARKPRSSCKAGGAVKHPRRTRPLPVRRETSHVRSSLPCCAAAGPRAGGPDPRTRPKRDRRDNRRWSPPGPRPVPWRGRRGGNRRARARSRKETFLQASGAASSRYSHSAGEAPSASGGGIRRGCNRANLTRRPVLLRSDPSQSAPERRRARSSRSLLVHETDRRTANETINRLKIPPPGRSVDPADVPGQGPACSEGRRRKRGRLRARRGAGVVGGGSGTEARPRTKRLEALARMGDARRAPDSRRAASSDTAASARPCRSDRRAGAR